MKKLILILCVIFYGTSAFASSSPLNFLYGKWQGRGVKGVTERVSSECNYPSEDGKIGVIQAKYVEVESQKTHLEFGVLSPTTEEGFYKFGMVRQDGSTLEGKAFVDGEKQVGILNFVIPSSAPNGIASLVRYTITVRDGHWLEIGEISTDSGVNWKKFYEMNLQKTLEKCRVLK